MTFEEYKSKYGIVLDDSQTKACGSIDGKVLLLAVPGSGKTTVMIARLGYMTRALHIAPDSILAITYSVAGAREMKTRYEKRFGSCDVEFRTIHGLCAVLISRYERIRGRTAFTLMEKEGDSASVLRRIMAESGSYPTENELREVQTAITYSKNSMLTDAEIERDVNVSGRDFFEIYKAYESYKRENRLMDYDDQLAYGFKILKSCPDVCAVYTDRFRYVCVDEAQDTSRLQHEIIATLVKRCGNVFMVGDEDQSIYGFRAAYPQALIDFDKTYPDAKVMSIAKNYRSTGKIVSLADRFIKANTERHGSLKTMVTDNPEGEMPKRVRLSDLMLLPDYVRRVCAEADGEGTTALLFRMNDSMLPVIDMLYSKEIPFRVRGGDGLFFTHSTVTDVISILDFAAHPYDTELFSRIYYKLSLGLNKSELQNVIKYNVGDDRLPIAEFIASSPYIKESKRAKAKKLARDLERINSSDTYEAIRTVFFDSGYGRYHDARTTDTSKRNALLALAYHYRTREELFSRLKMLESAVKRGSVSDEGLILSTIHSAKGMEFDKVILCDCKNGVLPSGEATVLPGMSDEDKRILEEERRLFYVGVTRAKKQLELITWESEFGSEVSGFDFVDVFLNGGVKKQPLPSASAVKNGSQRLRAERIAEEMGRYYVGVAVRHVQFGDGVISHKKDGVITVKFARYSVPKKLLLSTCIENSLISEI